MGKRVEFFAYIANEYTRVIRFTRHFSRLAAEKHYGDVSRHYRGNAWSDYDLTIIEGREKFELAMEDYVVDYEAGTATPIWF